MNKNHCQWLDIHRYRKNLCLRIRDARCGAGKSPLCGSPGTDCETGAEDQDNRIFLFIRKDKNDNEAKEFYFLGEIYAEGDPQPIQMAQSKGDAFEINYRLDRPVRDDIYEYIVEETL